MLKKAIQDMPIFEPDPSVWEKIEAKLDSQNTRARKRNVVMRKLYAVPLFWRMAAAIVLCLTMIIFLKEFLTNGSEKVTICYHEEKMPLAIDTVIASVFGPEQSNYPIHKKIASQLAQIDKVCQKQPEFCKDTIFTAIKMQIDTIDVAINETENKIHLYPDEESLIRVRTHLEQERNKTIKKLIQYVIT